MHSIVVLVTRLLPSAAPMAAQEPIKPAASTEATTIRAFSICKIFLSLKKIIKFKPAHH
jgi:hypothetical protein